MRLSDFSLDEDAATTPKLGFLFQRTDSERYIFIVY